MIGSAITADIDSDYGTDRAVRTLEFEIGTAEFVKYTRLKSCASGC